MTSLASRIPPARRWAVTGGRSAARPCVAEDQPPSVEESNAFLVDDAAGLGRRDSGSGPMIGDHCSRRDHHRSVRAESHMMFTPRGWLRSGSPRPTGRRRPDRGSAPAASTAAAISATPEPAERGSGPTPPPRTPAGGRGVCPSCAIPQIRGSWVRRVARRPRLPVGRVAPRLQPVHGPVEALEAFEVMCRRSVVPGGWGAAVSYFPQGATVAGCPPGPHRAAALPRVTATTGGIPATDRLRAPSLRSRVCDRAAAIVLDARLPARGRGGPGA